MECLLLLDRPEGVELVVLVLGVVTFSRSLPVTGDIKELLDVGENTFLLERGELRDTGENISLLLV